MICRIVALFAVAAALAAPHAPAGVVRGTVKFEGTPPVMKPVDMTAVPECHATHGGTPILNETLVLGAGQTLANVLVHVSGGLPAKPWPAPAEPVVVTQKGCVYAPHVVGMQAGQTLRFLNPDAMMHNVHGMPVKNGTFNEGMSRGVKELDVAMTEPEAPFPIKCDVHPWMLSYCAVFSHPFFKVTAADGGYVIEGLEPGVYELTAWHEKLGEQKASVTVTADAAAVQDFVFSRPKK